MSLPADVLREIAEMADFVTRLCMSHVCCDWHTAITVPFIPTRNLISAETSAQQAQFLRNLYATPVNGQRRSMKYIDCQMLRKMSTAEFQHVIFPDDLPLGCDGTCGVIAKMMNNSGNKYDMMVRLYHIKIPRDNCEQRLNAFLKYRKNIAKYLVRNNLVRLWCSNDYPQWQYSSAWVISKLVLHYCAKYTNRIAFWQLLWCFNGIHHAELAIFFDECDKLGARQFWEQAATELGYSWSGKVPKK